MKWQDMTRPERLDAIRRVYRPGMSSSEIGAALHTSWQSILGYYDRYSGLKQDCPLPPSGGSRLNTFATIGAGRRQPAPDIPGDDDDETHLGIILADLTSTTCRWPRRSPNDTATTFCGQPCGVTEPYCEHHGRRAYNVRLPQEKIPDASARDE